MHSFAPPRSTFRIAVWSVVRVSRDGSCHVFGYRLPSGRGRSSSPIRTFDPATDTVTTASGNRYVLVGGPSEDGLDDPLVLAWLAGHDLTRRDVEIVGPIVAGGPASLPPRRPSTAGGEA